MKIQLLESCCYLLRLDVHMTCVAGKFRFNSHWITYMHDCIHSMIQASFPGPCPAFNHLQYGKQQSWEGPGNTTDDSSLWFKHSDLSDVSIPSALMVGQYGHLEHKRPHRSARSKQKTFSQLAPPCNKLGRFNQNECMKTYRSSLSSVSMSTHPSGSSSSISATCWGL